MNQSEKSKILSSFYYPALIVGFMWLVKVLEMAFGVQLYRFGILPLTCKGIPGILTSPFIHSNLAHITSNSLPLLVLGSLLFYIYRTIAWRVLIFIWIITGFWVWILGRDSFHIGASGIVYGLAFFLFFSGIFRKDSRLLAITFLVAFLYGSMVWGIFPDLFPKKNISWESHLMGMIAGIVLAFFYRNEGGPARKIYSWEIEEETDSDDNDPDAYWKKESVEKHKDKPDSPTKPLQINYIYKKSSKEENNNNT